MIQKHSAIYHTPWPIRLEPTETCLAMIAVARNVPQERGGTFSPPMKCINSRSYVLIKFSTQRHNSGSHQKLQWCWPGVCVSVIRQSWRTYQLLCHSSPVVITWWPLMSEYARGHMLHFAAPVETAHILLLLGLTLSQWWQSMKLNKKWSSSTVHVVWLSLQWHLCVCTSCYWRPHWSFQLTQWPCSTTQYANRISATIQITYVATVWYPHGNMRKQELSCRYKQAVGLSSVQLQSLAGCVKDANCFTCLSPTPIVNNADSDQGNRMLVTTHLTIEVLEEEILWYRYRPYVSYSNMARYDTWRKQ